MQTQVVFSNNLVMVDKCCGSTPRIYEYPKIEEKISKENQTDFEIKKVIFEKYLFYLLNKNFE